MLNTPCYATETYWPRRRQNWNVFSVYLTLLAEWQEGHPACKKSRTSNHQRSSFIAGSKLPFSTNLFHHSLLAPTGLLFRTIRSVNRTYSAQRFSLYRQDAAKRRQPVFKFTHRSKISIFAPQWRLVAPIHVNLAQPRGTWVRLAVQNLTPIGARGGNAAHKMAKISTFW